MITDVHVHHAPRDAQKVAAEIGRRHHLKFEQNEHGRDGVTRDGKLWSGASVPGK